MIAALRALMSLSFKAQGDSVQDGKEGNVSYYYQTIFSNKIMLCYMHALFFTYAVIKFQLEFFSSKNSDGKPASGNRDHCAWAKLWRRHSLAYVTANSSLIAPGPAVSATLFFRYCRFIRKGQSSSGTWNASPPVNVCSPCLQYCEAVVNALSQTGKVMLLYGFVPIINRKTASAACTKRSLSICSTFFASCCSAAVYLPGTVV